MDDVMIQISQAGETNALYELIRKDAAILKRIDEIMFEDTPLHIAASTGQTSFAMEVYNLMPSFARKLNKDGLSPMHLALVKGHSELVLLLLRADRELVRVKGKGGMTPLHYAATQNGNIHLLAYYLAACPKSIEDITVESETALHIAVNNNTLDALEVLVGWLKRVCHEDAYSWMTNILNWRNKHGSTVLDIAVSNMQIEAIQLLAAINAKTSKGLTALRTLQSETKMDKKVVRKMLVTNRVSQALSPNRTKKSLANYLRSKKKIDEHVAVFIIRQKMLISDDLRNALLVVAAVIVSAIFQAAFSPPGSVRQENDNPTIVINGTYINTTVTNTTGNVQSPSKDMRKSFLQQIVLEISFWNGYLLCIVIGFIGLLLSDSKFGIFMILIMAEFLVGYALSTVVISPQEGPAKIEFFLLCLFIQFLSFIALLYVLGLGKIRRLSYYNNKCPKEAVEEEIVEKVAITTRNESVEPEIAPG